ncbi:unnamed protein product [Polarella glacialis]|uniref:Uncharacterized protein n=1 Tax=Polarella glacialis TaxID=89957 RepID=A0A813GZH7_POLGL|nr:unnamed protein product [Polarella glacialis]
MTKQKAGLKTQWPTLGEDNKQHQQQQQQKQQQKQQQQQQQQQQKQQQQQQQQPPRQQQQQNNKTRVRGTRTMLPSGLFAQYPALGEKREQRTIQGQRPKHNRGQSKEIRRHRYSNSRALRGREKPRCKMQRLKP